MNESSLGMQTHVYFKKLFRINMREKSWKYLIFALIISLLVAIIVGPDMFGNNNFEGTNSGFFTLASACIWIGIFNSIQSICKEHEIIRAEYRQGLRISAYVFAHVLWQALLCLAQTFVIFIVCCIFMDFSQSPHLLISAYAENFVTIYLLTFAAAILGLMISSISGNPTTAMTIMPFVLIIQLVMSGCLFQLKGVAKVISFFTLSRWGMVSFGCEADLYNTKANVEPVLEQFGYRYDNVLNSDLYKPEVLMLFLAWFAIIAITIFNIFVCGLALKIKNRDS